MENSRWRKFRTLIYLPLLVIACSSTVKQTDTGSVGSGKCTIRLAWDANQEPDLANYSVHVGTTSMVYDTVVGPTTATDFDVTGAECGTTYFIAVTASDTSGNVSEFSDEVSGDAS